MKKSMAKMSVIFDGTTHLEEALAIVVHYVNPEWKIVKRLVRLKMLVKSVNSEELARELVSVLSVNSISSQLLLAAMKDLAAVNEMAVHTLKIVYPNLLSISCFSYTIDCVGEHFNTPNLSDFITSCFHIVIKRSFCGLNRLESKWQLTA